MAFNPTIDTVNQLVDLDTVTELTGAKETDSDQKNLLKLFINSASWFCNTHTHRLLLERALTEYYSGDGSNVLFTNQYPITTITAVYDDLDRAYGSDTEIDSGDLVYMPETLAYKIIYDGGTFTKGIKNLKVEYTAGYSTIPYDLHQACVEIVMFYWTCFEKGLFGITSRTIGDGSLTVETANYPKSALQVLNTYRRKW